MRKRNSLPDFHKLCLPEQNHIADIVSLEIFFFFLCSVGGFLWEVLLMYVQDGHYVNRGFLYGPWLPIYGSGAVLFHVLLAQQPIYDGFASYLRRLFISFFLSALLGSLIELIVGYFLQSFWHLRYWNYSGYPFNFEGYICLWSALGFGIAGTLWLNFLSTFFQELFFRLSKKIRRNLNTILLLLFVFDCAASLIFPNKGHGITFLTFLQQGTAPSLTEVLQIAFGFSD